jgi:GntR family transcriptional regulator, transcriptional repressor for pyruvate dehydrogenase complex
VKIDMGYSIEPLRVHSLKSACVNRLEELILSGELKAGDFLPAERDLANRLGVSRPVLHEALVDLAGKGLVDIRPRRRVIVNDFRKSGSTAILSSLLNYHQSNFDPGFVRGLFDMRLLIETETARLAARKTLTTDEIAALQTLLAAEDQVDQGNPAAMTELDFEFHLQIALLSGNSIYPLIINSFKVVYTHFTAEFFRKVSQTPKGIEAVYVFHRQLVAAILAHNAADAAGIMMAMLDQGERSLKGAE